MLKPVIAYSDYTRPTISGGGGGNDGMESRVAKLESDVDYIKRDVTDIKTTLSKIDSGVTDIRISMATLTSKFDSIESKLDSFDKKYATKADLQEAFSSQLKWIIGTMLGLASLVAAVAVAATRIFSAS